MKLPTALAALALATLLGAVAVVAPPIVNGHQPEGVMEAVMLGVEKAGWLTGVLLVVAGFVGGLLWSGNPWIPGIATTWWLPVWSIVDAATATIERHNLLPFEWLSYVLGALLGVVGATLAQGVRQRIGRTG